jgi:MFS superfamily sulfate permease-like transporter
MNTYWFKPREYGYGATPVTWEGWALTVITMFIVVMTSMLAPVFARNGLSILAAVAFDALVIAAFLLISYMKTEGGWRSRQRAR